jgi:hypothetical protein
MCVSERILRLDLNVVLRSIVKLIWWILHWKHPRLIYSLTCLSEQERERECVWSLYCYRWDNYQSFCASSYSKTRKTDEKNNIGGKMTTTLCQYKSVATKETTCFLLFTNGPIVSWHLKRWSDDNNTKNRTDWYYIFYPSYLIVDLSSNDWFFSKHTRTCKVPRFFAK